MHHFTFWGFNDLAKIKKDHAPLNFLDLNDLARNKSMAL